MPDLCIERWSSRPPIDSWRQQDQERPEVPEIEHNWIKEKQTIQKRQALRTQRPSRKVQTLQRPQRPSAALFNKRCQALCRQTLTERLVKVSDLIPLGPEHIS